MSKSVNKLILVGTILAPADFFNASDPEAHGEPFARFQLRTDDGVVSYTHDVEAVGSLGIFARDHLSEEGARVYLEGRLCYWDRGPVVMARELVLLRKEGAGQLATTRDGAAV